MRSAALRADWEQALRARLGALLGALAAGDDAPPALRYKAEGLAEAGLALGLVSAPELAALLDAVYTECCGAPVAELFPFDASACVDAVQQRVSLPFAMRRAPVHPGTDPDGER
jgi:hypothetical protein